MTSERLLNMTIEVLYPPPPKKKKLLFYTPKQISGYAATPLYSTMARRLFFLPWVEEVGLGRGCPLSRKKFPLFVWKR